MKRVLCTLVLGGALLACKRAPDPRVTEEIARREAYAKTLLVDAGAPAAKIGNTADIRYEEGFSIVQLDPPDDWRSNAFRYVGKRGRVRLRVTDRPMHLKVLGWVNEKVIDTKPNIDVYVDSIPIWSVSPDEKGVFGFETDVSPDLTRGKDWVYLDIVPAAVAWHWSEPPELKVVILSELGWTPKP